ncbi:hypothetical protein IT6_05255 [Methylacidiphilum caldifontis]|uniref:hypothetical protein n=1 Tax=Methylacidiphilum caldifontis TaxID=2795386 RepID=UPI001A8F199A|nr:hypothetical protein [Methylacidiphilum caldifontis]QSR89671.1 hypothetical protein IT6_05255 [Methylacidiphilum caldifontis]
MYKKLSYLFIIALVLILGVFVAFISIVNFYLSSQGFRDFLSEKITRVIQVDGKFSPIHIQGNALSAEKYLGYGEPSSPIKQIDATSIECQLLLRKIFSRLIYIKQLKVDHLRVDFKKQDFQHPNSSISATPSSNPVEKRPLKESILTQFIPTKVELGQITIKSSTVSWPQDIAGGGKLENSSFELNKSEGTDMWIGQGSGGNLYMGSYPPFKLKELLFKLFSDHCYIQRLVLLHDLHGQVEISGEWSWKNREKNIEINLTALPLPLFIPPSWKGKINGNIYGKTFLTQSKASETSLEGTIHLENGVIGDLPLFASLALFGTKESVPLDLAKANLYVTKNKTQLNHIELEAKGKIKLEGQIEIDGDQIRGELLTGINPEQLKLIPGAKQKVFVQEKEGYQWTTVNITGSVEDPKEDLTPRITAAATSTLKENAGQILQSALDFLKKIQNQKPSSQ